MLRHPSGEPHFIYSTDPLLSYSNGGPGVLAAETPASLRVLLWDTRKFKRSRQGSSPEPVSGVLDLTGVQPGDNNRRGKKPRLSGVSSSSSATPSANTVAELSAQQASGKPRTHRTIALQSLNFAVSPTKIAPVLLEKELLPSLNSSPVYHISDRACKRLAEIPLSQSNADALAKLIGQVGNPEPLTAEVIQESEAVVREIMGWGERNLKDAEELWGDGFVGLMEEPFQIGMDPARSTTKLQIVSSRLSFPLHINLAS